MKYLKLFENFKINETSSNNGKIAVNFTISLMDEYGIPSPPTATDLSGFLTNNNTNSSLIVNSTREMGDKLSDLEESIGEEKISKDSNVFGSNGMVSIVDFEELRKLGLIGVNEKHFDYIDGEGEVAEFLKECLERGDDELVDGSVYSVLGYIDDFSPYKYEQDEDGKDKKVDGKRVDLRNPILISLEDNFLESCLG